MNLVCPAFKERSRIEQMRKGGLPPLATDLGCRDTAGVNHPSLLVHFKLHFEIAFPSSKGLCGTPGKCRNRRVKRNDEQSQTNY